MSDLINEDWLKRTWDIYVGKAQVTTLALLLEFLGVDNATPAIQSQAVEHMATLPVWQAAPAPLVAEVGALLTSKSLDTEFDVLEHLLDQMDLEEKFNDNHDERGRFASSDGGGGASGGGGGAHEVDAAERQETLHEAAHVIPGTDKSGKTVNFAERRQYLDKVIRGTQSTFNTQKLYDERGDAKNLYSPERAAAQKQIIDDVYARAGQVPNNREAIITGGLPGSGKSTGLETAFSNGWLQGKSSDYLVLNPDDMKSELAQRGLTPDESVNPKFAGLSPMEKAGLIHDESSYLTTQLADRAQADGKNVLWDITMNKESSVAARLDELDAAGYKKQMIFTDTDPAKATERAAGRYESGQAKYEAGENLTGGRFVSSDITGYKPNDQWVTQNRAVFETLKNRSDQWVSIDNNADRDPKLIEKSS